MRRPYQRGARMEHQAVEDLRAQGFEAQRTAGSHSPFDVVAWKETGVRLIQVKRVRRYWDVVKAVRESREAWKAHKPPTVRDVTCEVWVRFEGRWNVFELAGKGSPL